MRHIEETDDRFYIADSGIQNAGKGLYAKVRLNKNDFLEIIGVTTTCGSVVDRCTSYADRYKFANEPEEKFVHSLIPMGYAAIVNQANSPEQQNVSITHLPDEVQCSCGGECEVCGGTGKIRRRPRNPYGGSCVYLFLRDIRPGEELLGNYNKKIGQLVVSGQRFSPEDSEAWKEFLQLDLYGLGILISRR